jgi:hypothetical protein
LFEEFRAVASKKSGDYPVEEGDAMFLVFLLMAGLILAVTGHLILR